MIGCLPTQPLAFLAVFVYALTHATQAIAFEWKPGISLAIMLPWQAISRPQADRKHHGQTILQHGLG